MNSNDKTFEAIAFVNKTLKALTQIHDIIDAELDNLDELCVLTNDVYNIAEGLYKFEELSSNLEAPAVPNDFDDYKDCLYTNPRDLKDAEPDDLDDYTDFDEDALLDLSDFNDLDKQREELLKSLNTCIEKKESDILDWIEAACHAVASKACDESLMVIGMMLMFVYAFSDNDDPALELFVEVCKDILLNEGIYLSEEEQISNGVKLVKDYVGKKWQC